MISFVHMERGNPMADEKGIVLPWEKDAMAGIDVVQYLNTLPNDNANNYVAFHEYNKAEHFCSYGERRNDG